MIIGCPKEIKIQEYRVGLTPDNVQSYIAAGHTVFIEQGAGAEIGFSDRNYELAGATITDKENLFKQSEMIIKVKEPIESEYHYFKKIRYFIPTFTLLLTSLLPKCFSRKIFKPLPMKRSKQQQGYLALHR